MARASMVVASIPRMETSDWLVTPDLSSSACYSCATSVLHLCEHGYDNVEIAVGECSLLIG